MAEPLTNAILASILYLIRRDLTGNGRVPPRRAPSHWAPTRRQCHHPHKSGPRAATPPPQYRPMEPSQPRSLGQSLPGPPLPPFDTPYIPRMQVDLGRLAVSQEGITPFTVARLVRTPTSEEERRGSPAVEPLTRGTTDLSITDRPATPFHRADPPSPTPNSTNPKPNGLGSGSPPRISPLGNWVICRMIRLPTSTRT
jgi:hypothetical protein